jgi:DNA gyrase inhibitor GyrI
MRVASSYGFGAGPEGIAWQGLLAWMKEGGIPVVGSRFFGFNNPSPSAGNPNYGYEQWLVLDHEREYQQPGDKVSIKDFRGGRYAVLRHQGNPAKLPAAWSSLLLWAESSPHRRASHQWLEEFINPGLLDGPGEPDWDEARIDIYLPIE